MTAYIAPLSELGGADVARVGGKAANLGQLVAVGLPVPPGYVLTTAAYQEFVERNGLGPRLLELATIATDAAPERLEEASRRIRELFSAGTIAEQIVAELEAGYRALGPSAAVAVRSSATAEDLPGASFAGQQDTFLNVHGLDELVTAVRDCWASVWTARAVAYRARQGVEQAGVRLAVVVQRLVDADSAGVMFTANPGNGRRDEIVISAAWGLGESIVAGTVTTDDVVVSRRTGQVVSRVTADKAVMTVRAERGTVERPVPAPRRGVAVLDDEAARQLARLGERIEAHFGVPQDVEWARSGGEFLVVQARPITALPEPAAEPPSDWTVPQPKDFYFRASIVEQLPDPLSPLFADLVDQAVTRSLSSFFTEILGRKALREGELGLPTVNGYAYYRYSRAALLRLTLYSAPAFKLLVAGEDAGAVARWRDRARPRYARIVQDWTARSLADLSDDQLLAAVGELLEAGAAYYTSVQTIIPLAASSEMIFTWCYDRLVRRRSDPPATTFLLGFDSVPIRAEKSLYDLAQWVRTYEDLTTALAADGRPPSGEQSPVWAQWQARFGEHLARFGHATYNLDFVNPVPADDPAPLLATLRMYLRGEGTNPYERQARLAARREEQTARLQARLDPVRRAAFTRLLRWAQACVPLREDALADVGLAWPQMRRILAELGRRLVAAGTIAAPEEVFWLHPAEILGRDQLPVGAVEARRMLWRGQRKATPPQLLPQGTVLDRLESLMPAAAPEQTGAVIRGTGASGGRVTATARVLTGPADFPRMRRGDVLVTAITTPAWTSLFAMACAVVTDVGGPLSHSSIVAREYGIPAVLGTNVATRRIPDGARILVDGDAGTVTLLDGAAGGDEEADGARSGPRDQARRSARRPRAALAAMLLAVGIGVVARRRHVRGRRR